jgi:hypothetical protein
MIIFIRIASNFEREMLTVVRALSDVIRAMLSSTILGGITIVCVVRVLGFGGVVRLESSSGMVIFMGSRVFGGWRDTAQELAQPKNHIVLNV